MSVELVDLAPPLTCSTGYGWGAAGLQGPTVWLQRGPRYVRRRTMGRWHRIRSGYRIEHDQRWVASLWCGQSINNLSAVLAVDNPGRGEPVCGTCEGRALGAGMDDNPLDVDLIFEPRHLLPPKRCPGSRTMICEELPGGRAGRCLVCGDVLTLRAGGSHYGYGYGGSYGLTNHAPGAALIPACPFHAWKDIIVARVEETGETVAICRCQTVRSP